MPPAIRWMKGYLIDLGATETAENLLVTDKWQAAVRKSEPVEIGSLVAGHLADLFEPASILPETSRV